MPLINGNDFCQPQVLPETLPWRRMIQYLFIFALVLTVTTLANAGEAITDDVFVRAAEKMRQTIQSTGTDRAALVVEQCYLQANEQEREFGPFHATCVTQDYLLTTVLALPYDRRPWWPPYNKANRYDILAPAFQSRVANMLALLNTPSDVVNETRRRLFFIAVKAFNEQ